MPGSRQTSVSIARQTKLTHRLPRILMLQKSSRLANQQEGFPFVANDPCRSDACCEMLMNQPLTASATPAMWQFVPLEQYAIPGDTQLNWVRKKRRALGRLLRSEQNEGPARAETELRALPDIRLEHLVPPIDWAPAAPALDQAIRNLDSGQAEVPAVRCVIGQPYGGHATIVERWAADHSAVVLPAPPHDTILAKDDHWLETHRPDREPWVVPALERWFLRHADGLAVVRRFLDRALSGDWGEGLIGCDSWAWTYLQRVLALSAVPTLTLQAFDGRRLARYFFQATCRDIEPRPRVCNASTGRSVLPDEEALAADDFEASSELRQLAAHCRGNLGTAWKYWRTRLRAEGEAQADDEAASSGNVLWLANELTEPILPAETGEETLLILHVLLLHNGLPAERLSDLLPMLRSQIGSNLLPLEARGLVESNAGCWRVAALGYAAVRDLLRERQYLTDPC